MAVDKGRVNLPYASHTTDYLKATTLRALMTWVADKYWEEGMEIERFCDLAREDVYTIMHALDLDPTLNWRNAKPKTAIDIAIEKIWDGRRVKV